MSKAALQISNLSKRYRIGIQEERHDTLAGALLDWVKSPLTNYRRLRKLSKFEDGDASDDIIWALRDVSFEVEQGDVVGIIGRNGAGKSTLLKILSRITEPTSGRAVIQGRVSSLLEVGTGFHPELTGRENVYLNGTVLGMSKQEVDRKFDEIVAFSGVEKFIDTPVKRYSSGMKVRLAFSVAAHLEPEVLLVDEVLAVGDAGFQKKCLGKMEDVSGEGRTVVFVSHDMTMMDALCRRVILLKDGRLAMDGDGEEVIRSYLNDAEMDAADGRLRSLRSRSDSGAIKKFRFSDWWIRDAVHGEGRQIVTDSACEFVLEFESLFPPEQVSNASIALVVKDSFGRPILSGSTKMVDSDFAQLPREGKLICRFDNLPLAPGRYRLHLWAAINGEEADRLENAGSFEVLPADVFGTGRLPETGKHGAVVMKRQQWEIEHSTLRQVSSR